MNRLQYESSPYLRQHADNPVDWYPWSPEALKQARLQDKPILLSVGYSTCHWCHVMEKESFSDSEVADFMNAHFVNIKVDREERPDLDQLYMEACQIISRTTGWPLNIFLTPDGKPFFGGTYFPTQENGRQMSWLKALQYVLYNFKENRQAVEKQGERILYTIQGQEPAPDPDQLEIAAQGNIAFEETMLVKGFDKIQARFDLVHGGFGEAPKFPDLLPIRFLLNHTHFAGAEAAREHAFFSLDSLLKGGIYDQLGGGIARYSVTEDWLVPHFEKMLYDNALLVQVLSEAYKMEARSSYEEAIRETLAFVERELTRPEGGFYAALDADSEGEEGKYYTWTRKEVQNQLGDLALVVCAWFDIRSTGNWEGTNILRRTQDLDTLANRMGLSILQLKNQLERGKQKLFHLRQFRTPPSRDEKILTGWNALMISAYARSAAALADPSIAEKAEKHLIFLLENLVREPHTGRLWHSWIDGHPQQEAYLQDYALLIQAILDLQQVTYQHSLLHRAERFADYALKHFWDEKTQLFFLASDQQTDIILRQKEWHDLEIPSGNSIMAANLHALGILLDRQDYLQKSEQMLFAAKKEMERNPAAMTQWLTNWQHFSKGMVEIAVVGKDYEQLAEEINQLFLPHKVLMASPDADEHFPLLTNRPAREETLIYVCKNYACQRPVRTVEEMLEMGV